jgi:hypothetical protein
MFSAPVQTGRGAHPASYTMGTGSCPGVKRPGRGVDHPPPTSAEVKEWSCPSAPLWAFVAYYRVSFTFIGFRPTVSISGFGGLGVRAGL